MSSGIRVALVDDNEIDLLNLRTLLESQPEIKVVGEAGSLAAARDLIETAKPEAIFLDIQLGRETGFALLEELTRPPLVIFTTLHREYAVKAFEVKAVDYLVKPIAEERLCRSVGRLRGALAAQTRPMAVELADLLVFKKGSERFLVAVDKIASIRGDGDYTQVVITDGREFLDDRRMREWQEILPAKHFPTLDRSTIVRLAEVASYQPTAEGGILVWRNSPTPLAIGRAAFKRLEECFLRGVLG